MYFKTLFKIFRKQGCRSSVAFYARADMQTKDLRSSVTFLARADCKSTGYMKFTLDGRSTPARAWDTSPRSSVHSLARADCKHMQSTGYTHFTLERYFPGSSGLHELIVYARVWSLTLERGSKFWNFQIKPSSSKSTFKASKPILFG